MTRIPPHIDWSSHLQEGEKVLWTEQSNPSSLFGPMFLGMLFFGICAWPFGQNLFVYDSLAQACGEHASGKCAQGYYLAWPLFLTSAGFVALSILAIALHSLGLHKFFYAITNRRALKKSVGIFNKFSSIDLAGIEVSSGYILSVKFGNGKPPKFAFQGLTAEQAGDVVYWAKRTEP